MQKNAVVDFVEQYQVLVPFAVEAAPKVSAISSDRGFLNLKCDLPNVETGVAFAAFENESVHQRETLLKLRSDDLLKVYFNGKEVMIHRHGVSDTPIFLQAATGRR